MGSKVGSKFMDEALEIAPAWQDCDRVIYHDGERFLIHNLYIFSSTAFASRFQIRFGKGTTQAVV